MTRRQQSQCDGGRQQLNTPTTLMIGAIAGLLHWRMLTTASTKWAAFVGITAYIGAWLILLSVPDFFFGSLINGQSLLEIRIRYILTFTIASGLIAVILTLVIRQLMRLVAALRT